jgi:3-methyladenine DNA glycosylase AlkD
VSRPAISPVTLASNNFVAAHQAGTSAIGERLAELVSDPDAFVAAIQSGFETLADPVYADGSRSVAPGLGPILGVRLPLMEAVHRTFKRDTRETSTSILIEAMDRLLRQDLHELRWFGIWNLGRLLPTDPERTWQLLRRAARESDEWITVDTLAHPYGEGVLRDPRRWAEIEQLVYSSSRWERRLVGSTIATLPHARGVSGGRSPVVVERGLALVGQLIGDAEPDVQKAISWAIRAMAGLDQSATARFLTAEAETARANDDGQRAWVIRDSLSKLPEATATVLRHRVDGIRRRPGAPSTSHAAAAAAGFLGAIDAGATPRPDRSPVRSSSQ